SYLLGNYIQLVVSKQTATTLSQKHMKAFIPLLLVAALSGCAVIDPGEPNVSQLDAAQVGLQHSNAPWPTTQWWHRYNDSQLTQLIDQALLGSPSMDAAQARLAMANAAVGGARAVQLPQADVNFKATRQRFSGNYIYPPPYGGSMMTDADLRLNLGFDLDLWGRNRSRYAAAVSSQRAAMADLQMARNTLVSAVIQSYYKLQGALAQQTVLGEIVKQQENVLDIT